MILALDVEHGVMRQSEATRLQVFLQTRLGVLERLRLRQCGNARREQLHDYGRGRLEATVEVDRSKHRFERVSEDGLTPETAALELTGPQLQGVAET